MTTAVIALALCLTASVHTDAQSQENLPPFTLDQAYQKALKQTPALSRLEHQAAAAGQRVRQAQAGLLPYLAVAAAATDGPAGAPAFGVTGIAGDPLKKHYGAGLNLLQPLYDFGRTEHLVAARRALFQAAQEDTSTQEALILLTVTQFYLNVLRQQQLVGVQEAVVRQRAATVQQAQVFVDAGLKADVDLQLAKAGLSDAQVALIAAQNDVRLAFAGLNNAMGETTLTEYRLEAPPTAGAGPGVPSAAPTAEALMSRAVDQRPELRSAALQVRSAEQSIQAARSDLLPRVDGIASFGAIVPSRLIADNKNYAVGLSLTIPLYTGGAVEGRIAEERERREAALSLQREVGEAVKLQVARAWLNVQTRQSQLQAAADQAAAARSAQQQAGERYRLQLSSIVELTTAEAAAARAETQLVDAAYDLDVARAELDWATGTAYRRYARPAKRR